MLVLSRKVGERIYIGNDIFVEVRRVAGSRVTVAVNAPKKVRILRGELMESAKAFEVLEEPPVANSEATTDTVVMSIDDASAVLPPTDVTDKPKVPGQSHTIR